MLYQCILEGMKMTNYICLLSQLDSNDRENGDFVFYTSLKDFLCSDLQRYQNSQYEALSMNFFQDRTVDIVQCNITKNSIKSHKLLNNFSEISSWY